MSSIAHSFARYEKTHSVFRRGYGLLFRFCHADGGQIHQNLLLLTLEDCELALRIREVKHRPVWELDAVKLKTIRKHRPKHGRDLKVGGLEGRTKFIPWPAAAGIHMTDGTTLGLSPPERVRLKPRHIFRASMEWWNHHRKQNPNQTSPCKARYKCAAHRSY